MITNTPIDNALDYASQYKEYECKRGAAERQAQCQLFREVFGNPFCPMALDPAWLTWNAGAVFRIAERIYEERRFEAMPVLGDALEEAGCVNGDILDHCRGPGPHVPGCWLLDLLLDKTSIVLAENRETPTLLVEREL
jgi:hypothetical protein